MRGRGTLKGGTPVADPIEGISQVEQSVFSMKLRSWRKQGIVFADQYDGYRWFLRLRAGVCFHQDDDCAGGLALDHCHETGHPRAILCVVHNNRQMWADRQARRQAALSAGHAIPPLVQS